MWWPRGGVACDVAAVRALTPAQVIEQFRNRERAETFTRAVGISITRGLSTASPNTGPASADSSAKHSAYSASSDHESLSAGMRPSSADFYGGLGRLSSPSFSAETVSRARAPTLTSVILGMTLGANLVQQVWLLGNIFFQIRLQIAAIVYYSYYLDQLAAGVLLGLAFCRDLPPAPFRLARSRSPGWPSWRRPLASATSLSSPVATLRARSRCRRALSSASLPRCGFVRVGAVHVHGACKRWDNT